MQKRSRHRCRQTAPVGLALVCFGLLLGGGCTSLRLGPTAVEKTDKEPAPSTPSKYSRRVSQFVFFSDFELQSDLPIFKELSTLRDHVYKELQLPTANSVVQVYLFEDRDRYERFIRAKYPDLPRRRAFFVEQQRTGFADDLLVYTYWGDRVQQDLRHELTHALLHSVLKVVPIWLDEGLAEYYELPLEWKGVNYQHLEALRRGGFKPDLGRLEQLSQVQQMTPTEYREAWAWVQLMLQGPPQARTVLLNYLQILRTNTAPPLLGPKLAAEVPNLEDALTKHLAQLDVQPHTPAMQK